MLREKVDEFSINSPKSVVDIFMNILKDELKEHFYVIYTFWIQKIK